MLINIYDRGLTFAGMANQCLPDNILLSILSSVTFICVSESEKQLKKTKNKTNK